MAIVLTKYIYPLENEIPFINSKGLVFDNPRTNDEKKLILDFLKKSLQLENNLLNNYNDELLFKIGLSRDKLKDYLRKKDPNSYAYNAYNNADNSLIKELSETWIVVRFNDDGVFERILNDKIYLFNDFLSNKKSNYPKLFTELNNISHVISLISNFEVDNYHGETFILTSKPYDIFCSIDRYKIVDILENFADSNFHIDGILKIVNWLYWLDGYENLLKDAKRINNLILKTHNIPKGTKIKASQKESNAQKLIHIGNYLRMSYCHFEDPELMLILLVSIFEYLLTRKNVDESINKQFKRKCEIIFNTERDDSVISNINKELDEIYNQRSNIAHGNYDKNYSINNTIETVLQLYKYLRITINQYINNTELIEQLKDN